MKKINRIGLRYGSLTVVGFEGKNGKEFMWRCRCDCGAFVSCRGNNLNSGNSESCGCSNGKPSKHRIDISGQRFGRLVAIEPIEGHKSKHLKWVCKCDCGNITEVKAMKLRRGSTRSCGCLQRSIKRLIHGGVGAGSWAKTVKNCHEECLRCGSKKKLNAHHIVPVSVEPEMSRDFCNGATLCFDCHSKFHRIYGKESATVENFCEFIDMEKNIRMAFDLIVNHRRKNGIEDLRKAIHEIELMIELEYPRFTSPQPDIRQKIQDSLDELKKQDSVELPSITGYGWHNPENVTQEQLGEGYRFLVPWEVDGRYRRGICDIWFGRSEWDKKANGDNLDYTYRVPASTPIPPKP